MSALVRLENSGTAEALWEVKEALSEGLRESGDEELRRAFAERLRQVTSRRFGEGAPLVADALEGGGAMLAEQMQEWIEQWIREGRAQGIDLGMERGRAEGHAEERALLCRLASQKFGAETGVGLSGLLARLADWERLAEVGGLIIGCGTGTELLDRAKRLARPSRRRPERWSSAPESPPPNDGRAA